jgi:hypothetical protein
VPFLPEIHDDFHRMKLFNIEHYMCEREMFLGIRTNDVTKPKLDVHKWSFHRPMQNLCFRVAQNSKMNSTEWESL